MTEDYEDKTKIPHLDDADVGELHVFAMHAWQGGARRVEIDPSHAVALAEEVRSHRRLSVNSERRRCVAVIDEMIEAAEAKRKGHHATPWLQHARTAIADGVTPGGELSDADASREDLARRTAYENAFIRLLQRANFITAGAADQLCELVRSGKYLEEAR